MRKPFYPSLEAARGFAAVQVAAFHVGLGRYYASPGIIDALVHPKSERTQLLRGMDIAYSLLTDGNGAVAAPVLFFFVLSGFVLSSALSNWRRSPGDFLVGRVFRIYPAAMIAVIGFIILFYPTGLRLPNVEFSLAVALENLFLADVSINGVMWTLQVELIGSIVVLAGYLIRDRIATWALVVVAISLALFSFTAVAHNVASFGSPSRIAYLYAFLFGSVAFYVGEPIVAALGRLQTATLAAAVAVYFFAAPIACGSFERIVEFGARTAFIHICAATCIVALLAFGGRNLFKTTLENGFSRFYGRISYSFYLLHPLTLTVVWFVPGTLTTFVALGIPRMVIALILLVITTALITPLAYLSWRFVEKPGIRLGQRLLTPKTETSAGLAIASSPKVTKAR